MKEVETDAFELTAAAVQERPQLQRPENKMQ